MDEPFGEPVSEVAGSHRPPDAPAPQLGRPLSLLSDAPAVRFQLWELHGIHIHQRSQLQHPAAMAPPFDASLVTPKAVLEAYERLRPHVHRTLLAQGTSCWAAQAGLHLRAVGPTSRGRQRSAAEALSKGARWKT